MTLCLVTDRRKLSPDARTPRDEALALLTWLEEAVVAGVDLIHVRERDLPARALRDVLRGLGDMTRGSRTRVVANDRVDVAAVTPCDGVHLRGDGPSADRVRSLGPAHWTVGRSVHGIDDARAATADYLLFGAVFPSGAKPARGVEALRQVVAAVAAPVLAIGGMTAERARACVQAGAAGVAAIGLFLPPGHAEHALGIAGAVQAVRRAIDPAPTGHLQ